MPCQIEDTYVDINGVALPGLVVTAVPTAAPLFESFSGTFKEVQPGILPATTDGSGIWSITLPFPSLCDPSSTQWVIKLPDSTEWVGTVPEGVAGPITLKSLKDSHGWTLLRDRPGITVATGPPGPAIAGPQGAQGPTGTPVWKGAWSGATAYVAGDAVSDGGSSYVCKLAHTNFEPPNSTYWTVLAQRGLDGATGPAGTSIDATTTTTGVVEVDHAPSGSHPTALTTDGTVMPASLLGTSASKAAAGNDARLSDARTPTTHATSHEPGGSDELFGLTDAQIAAANKDGVAGTASLRTLGTGAQQATAGNDSRLSNARTPTAHESTHEAGGSDTFPWSTINGSGTDAGKPAAGSTNSGYLYHATDTKKVYKSNGSVWSVVLDASGAGGGSTATTTITGSVLIEQTPTSGNPRALTSMSRGLPNGLASIGTDGQLSSMYDQPEGAQAIIAETARWDANHFLWGGTGTAAAQEPCVIVEGGVIKCWWTHEAGAGNTARLAYATCSGDPTNAGNWTQHGDVLGAGVGGFSGWLAHISVTKFDGVYHLYFADDTPGNLYHSTSLDGTTWTTPTISISKTQVGWSTGWNNSYVWQEGTTWYMLVEGTASGQFLTTLATSTDGLAWTFPTGGFLSSLRPNGGVGTNSAGWMMYPQKRNGLYHVWYHADNNGLDLPSDIYHATSSDRIFWTILNSGNPVISRSSGAYDQVADPCIFEQNGKTYMMYERVNNSTSLFEMCIASAPCTVAQLIDGSRPIDAIANGFAPLDGGGLVPLADIPSIPLSQLSQSGATTGQLVQWNGSAWVPATSAGGGGSGELLVQDGVTSPPLALYNESGDDFLYQG